MTHHSVTFEGTITVQPGTDGAYRDVFEHVKMEAWFEAEWGENGDGTYEYTGEPGRDDAVLTRIRDALVAIMEEAGAEEGTKEEAR